MNKLSTLHQTKSIMLSYDKKLKKGIPIKIENYLLDLYAQKKYKTSFIDSKEKVAEDIRNLSKNHNTKIAKELKALIIMELVSDRIKKEIKSDYI